MTNKVTNSKETEVKIIKQDNRITKMIEVSFDSST